MCPREFSIFLVFKYRKEAFPTFFSGQACFAMPIYMATYVQSDILRGHYDHSHAIYHIRQIMY